MVDDLVPASASAAMKVATAAGSAGRCSAPQASHHLAKMRNRIHKRDGCRVPSRSGGSSGLRPARLGRSRAVPLASGEKL